MTPYATFPGGFLYCADAIDALKELPDASVDLCVTHPPYYDPDGPHRPGVLGREKSVEGYLDRLEPIVEEVFRVLAEDGAMVMVMGGEKTQYVLDCVGSVWQGLIVPDNMIFYRLDWNRDAVCIFTKGFRNLEVDAVFSVSRPARGVVANDPLTPDIMVYYDALPDDIPCRAIKLLCPEGGTVLDPFAGNGTVLKMAKEMGRKFMGVEVLEDFCRHVKGVLD